MKIKVDSTDNTGDPNCPQRRGRKAYVPPTLVRYGDLRSLTLSPSPGTFESGTGFGPGFRGQP